MTVLSVAGAVTAGAALALRHEGAAQARQLVAGEEYAQVLLGGFAVAIAHRVDVVPAILVKGIGQQRRTHHEFHLLAAHAWLQLVHLFLRDDVALIDIDAINPRELPVGAAGEQQCICKKNSGMRSFCICR